MPKDYKKEEKGSDDLQSLDKHFDHLHDLHLLLVSIYKNVFEGESLENHIMPLAFISIVHLSKQSGCEIRQT